MAEASAAPAALADRVLYTKEVITWEKAKELIEAGTLESLAELKRSEQQLATYRAAMDKVKQEYRSVTDFIQISVLERACRINPEGKKEAVDMEHSEHQLVWHLNDFPYFFEEDVQHWLLWSPNRPLELPDIQREAARRFPDSETLAFVNPAALQSVLTIWHCHVLVRPKRPQ